MKSIYILDDYYLSAGSGIGTYLKNLVVCASFLEEVKISVIELRTNESEFRICRLHSVDYLLLPAIHERHYLDNTENNSVVQIGYYWRNSESGTSAGDN